MNDHPGLILGFSILVVVMLLLDLGVFNKKSHIVTNKEAITWSLIWISLSMGFSLFVYYFVGFEQFTQFQSAYWIEKSLSVDNLFVFILVFGFFKVPRESEHKVLFWGVIGALFLRALFIFSGVALIRHTYLPEMVLFGMSVKINILLTLFGGFLVYAGIKSWFVDEEDDEKDFSQSPGAKFIRKIFKGRVTGKYDNSKFFIFKHKNKDEEYDPKTWGNRVKPLVVKYATPLLVVVGVIEFTDLLFAVDSIPAIFAIAPNDPFILYTSNIFAILGLRSLYFLLSNFIHMFSRLKYGLALILSFIGVKMVIAPFFHIESLWSLVVVGGVLIGSIGASLLFPVKEA